MTRHPDPTAIADHKAQAREFLARSREYLPAGDLHQASEKGWGADINRRARRGDACVAPTLTSVSDARRVHGCWTCQASRFCCMYSTCSRTWAS